MEKNYSTTIEEPMRFEDNERTLLQESVAGYAELAIFEGQLGNKFTRFILSSATREQLADARRRLGECVMKIFNSKTNRHISD